MSQPLKRCPDGHPASKPYWIYAEQTWWLSCTEPSCGWHTAGTSEAETIRHWQSRAPGPATATMLKWCQALLNGATAEDWPEVVGRFMAEWQT